MWCNICCMENLVRYEKQRKQRLHLGNPDIVRYSYISIAFKNTIPYSFVLTPFFFHHSYSPLLSSSIILLKLLIILVFHTTLLSIISLLSLHSALLIFCQPLLLLSYFKNGGVDGWWNSSWMLNKKNIIITKNVQVGFNLVTWI